MKQNINENSFLGKDSASVRYCKADGRPCHKLSYDIILMSGGVISFKCRRGSRGRFTRDKSGAGF